MGEMKQLKYFQARMPRPGWPKTVQVLWDATSVVFILAESMMTKYSYDTLGVFRYDTTKLTGIAS